MNKLKTKIKQSLVNTQNQLNYQYFSVFPTKVDIMSPLFIQKPHQILHKLRKISPIHYLPKQKAWLAINYDDVVTILTQHDSFSNASYQNVDNGVLVGADPPEHTRIRNIIKEHFSYQQILHFQKIIEYHTKSFSEKIIQLQEFDLLTDLAQPLTNTIIAEFFGIDAKKISEVKQQKQQYNSLETLKPVLIGDGILSRICQDERLSEQEIVNLIALLLDAGIDTTRQAIGNSVYILLHYPQLIDEIRNNYDLIPELIEELLRIEPVFFALPRIALKDVQLGSVTIPSGSVVHASLVGANRDPQKFEQPDQVILHRKSPKPLNFGLGFHRCIGRHLANLQIQIFMSIFLTDFPPLKSVYPLKKIKLGTDTFARGVRNLKLAFY